MIRVLRKIFDQELVVRTSAGLVRGERKLSSLNKEVSETSKLNFINKKGYDVKNERGMEWNGKKYDDLVNFSGKQRIA